MRSHSFSFVALALAACASSSPPSKPPVAATPDAAAVVVPPAPPDAAPPPIATMCEGPSPGPGYKCIQDCGPPVVRQGDPPPAWHWLSPDQVAARERGGCPRCLPGTARIATPRGDVAVSELVPGQAVWTADESGARVAATVVSVVARPAPAGHKLVRAILADGRSVAASVNHPVRGGAALGSLRAGDVLDGSRITRVEIVDLEGTQTYDLLPSGSTHTYWADGVLLESTLPSDP